MNYSQSTEALNDFIRWSRNSEVRKRRLKQWLKNIDKLRSVGINSTDALNYFIEAAKILKQQ